MFIEKADLLTKILEDELEEITREDNTLITAAIGSAIQEMDTWLYDSYVTETIWEQTGDGRNKLLIDLGTDIALYLLVARVQAGQDVADRKDRYDRAIRLLKQIQKSETYANLPRREDTKQEHISYGSRLKRNNYF